ncbi:hypothetical protein C0Q70_07604 [Pomacea canaliculata]|uniref:C2H2-type domain-containing protein n=1 Tax=Pomacea canaliculata TaxID=400727 RepID=A0A2T7PFH7_POMCA|nr:hypothetical protein C0Q70_07604 [Pomacea canaliculata]
MVTSAPAHDKDSGDNIHYLRSDRNDSLSSSDAELDYNDDDVFVGRRQMNSSGGMGLGRCPNDFLPRSHQVYFKGSDGEFSDGEKEGGMLRDARLPHPYAMYGSQYFPDTNGLMPGLTSQPDFIRAGFHGSRGSSENMYTYSQSRVAPPLGGQPSVKQERDKPASPGSADGSHGNNNNGSCSSTDIGHLNARYPPGYKNEAPAPEGSSAREPDVGSMPLHPPAMKFPLTSNRLPPFPPMPGGFGGAGGGMILSPTSGLPQPPFLNRLAPGVQPSAMLNSNDSHLYFCHICEYSGPTKEEFDQHMVVHFGYRCPHCDYTSRTEGRLKRHIKDFHTDTENKQRAVPGRPKVYRSSFWDHARTHIKEDKLLQCPNCPFVTEYRHHLEYHLRNHFGSKPYKCGKCNYSCVNRSMLNSHMKSHTNVYQYRCADCTYATKYCHSLKLHLRKHRHQPAAVLNSDGSLPQGIDAKMSGLTLVAKRGPPRGPRGLRKEKDNNVAPESMMSGLFPMRHPLHHTGAYPCSTAQLWQQQVTGPCYPTPYTHRRPLSLRELLEREGSGAEKEGAAGGFKCNFCNFLSDTIEQLEFHLKNVHELKANEGLCKPPTNNTLQPPPAALEDQATKLQARRMSAPPPSHPPTSTSLAVQADTMYRRSSVSEASPSPAQQNSLASHSSEASHSRVNSLSRNAYDQSSPKIRSPLNDYNIFPKSQIPMAGEQGRDGPPQEDGADIIRQMTLKFGPLPQSSPPPSLQQQQQLPLAASLPPYMSSMTSIASPPSEPAALKESPLDLTNKPKSASPPYPGSPSPPTTSTLEPAVHLKRGFAEPLVASSEENSCNGGEVHGSSPRKRSRKGKAYKLEALCLKLQEKQTSSSPYQSDSNESDPADIQALAAPSTPTPAPAASVRNGGLEVAVKKESSNLQDKPEEADYDGNCGFGAADDPPDGDEYEGLRQNLNDDAGATHQRVAALEKFNLGNPPFSPPRPPVMSRPDASGSTPTSPTASTSVYREEPERGNTILLNEIYHHRRKLVTPAMRRGAEVAWKILHDPANGLPVEVKADEPSPRSLLLPPNLLVG